MIIHNAIQLHSTPQTNSSQSSVPIFGDSFADALAKQRSEYKTELFSQPNPAAPADLFGEITVTSSIKATLPENGKTLETFRFEHKGGNNFAALPQSNGKYSPTSDFVRKQDENMLNAFLQLAAFNGAALRKEDIQMEGTAAINLKV